jgi:hypothetical protein
MYSFFKKFIVLSIAVFGLMAFPLHAQTDLEKAEQPFIQQGDFLTGFSLSFTNTTGDFSDPQSGNEFSRLFANLDGLFFVSDHFGIGPTLAFRFDFQDLDATMFGDGDSSSWNLIYGLKAGWYTSANELFGTSSLGRAQFFVDGGVSLLSSWDRSGGSTVSDEPRFGYQVGTGFLFPVGEQIAIETRLGFQSRIEELLVGDLEREWLKDVTLSLGLKVKL